MTALLFAVLEATWPPAARHAAGPFTIRDGQGGGKRVSAATADGAWSGVDIDRAETAMTGLGQPPLFMIRDTDTALDKALATRGYRLVDPTILYAAPITSLGPAPDPMTAFPHWPPLAIAETIWADGGIGPARLAVMHRVAEPRAAILGRSRDRPSGAAFIAVTASDAMLHALEVPASQRRQGSGANILRAAAAWAALQGAERLVLAVTVSNAPARALYASLGMQDVGRYHYRAK